jgi:hypothetical protein
MRVHRRGPDRGLIFVWLSKNCRLAVVVVFVTAVFVILFILVVVGVPRRRRRGSAN